MLGARWCDMRAETSICDLLIMWKASSTLIPLVTVESNHSFCAFNYFISSSFIILARLHFCPFQVQIQWPVTWIILGIILSTHGSLLSLFFTSLQIPNPNKSHYFYSHSYTESTEYSWKKRLTQVCIY